MSRYPKKPDKLDPNCMWAAVAQIHRSDGHGPGERTWACEMANYGSTERAAIDAARGWWEETDQSDECEVTISIERADGTVVDHRIVVGMELVARRVSLEVRR